MIIEESSLIDARMRAALEEADAGADFAEGHELDAAQADLVPAKQVGRMLTIAEARKLSRGAVARSPHPVREGGTKPLGAALALKAAGTAFIVAPKLVAPPPHRPPRHRGVLEASGVTGAVAPG